MEQYPGIFAVKRADILAQSMYMRREKLDYVDAYEKMYDQIMEKGDCLTLKQLAVSGRDLLELGVPQGKQIGGILKQLLEQVVEDPEKNQRTCLMELAGRIISQL